MKKTRTKADMTPMTRLILRHLSDLPLHTPATVESIALAVESPADSVREYLKKLVREGIIHRTLVHHTAYFALFTDASFTELRIPGATRTFLKLTTPTSDLPSAVVPD
jgi:hypothetical protein